MPKQFVDKKNPDNGPYKTREGSDTGYRPNTKPPRFDAADDPKVANPYKEAGKGAVLRPVTNKYENSSVWDKVGPNKRIEMGGILQNDQGHLYWVIGETREGSDVYFVKTNPKFCSSCGLNVFSTGMMKMAKASLQKMKYLKIDLSDMTPEQLPDILTSNHPECPGDPVQHALLREEGEE